MVKKHNKISVRTEVRFKKTVKFKKSKFEKKRSKVENSKMWFFDIIGLFGQRKRFFGPKNHKIGSLQSHGLY